MSKKKQLTKEFIEYIKDQKRSQYLDAKLKNSHIDISEFNEDSFFICIHEISDIIDKKRIFCLQNPISLGKDSGINQYFTIEPAADNVQCEFFMNNGGVFVKAVSAMIPTKIKASVKSGSTQLAPGSSQQLKAGNCVEIGKTNFEIHLYSRARGIF